MRTIPYSVIVTWPIPNYVNPPTQGYANLIVNVICMAIVIPLVALRLFARWHMRKWIGWDDAFCALAVVFAVALSVCVIVANYRYDCNRHIWDIPINLLETNLKIVMTTKALFTVAGTCIRQSLLFFYLRLIGEAGMKKFRWAIHFTTFINVAIGIAFICLTVFQCTPVRAYWLVPSEKYGTCLDEGTVTFVCGLIVTVVDICVVLLPVPIVARLQMSLRQKVGVICLLTLGLFAAIAAILRTYYIYKAVIGSYDETWYAYPLWMIAVIETDLAILASCAPALRPFIIKHAPWILIPFQWAGSILLCRPSRRVDRNKNHDRKVNVQGMSDETATTYGTSTVVGSSEDSDYKKKGRAKQLNEGYYNLESTYENTYPKEKVGQRQNSSWQSLDRLTRNFGTNLQRKLQPQQHILQRSAQENCHPTDHYDGYQASPVGDAEATLTYAGGRQAGLRSESDVGDGESVGFQTRESRAEHATRSATSQRRRADKDGLQQPYQELSPVNRLSSGTPLRVPWSTNSDHVREQLDIRAAIEAAVPKKRTSGCENDVNPDIASSATSRSRRECTSLESEDMEFVYEPNVKYRVGTSNDHVQGPHAVETAPSLQWLPDPSMARSKHTALQPTQWVQCGETTAFYDPKSHLNAGLGEDVWVPIVQRPSNQQRRAWRTSRTSASMPYPFPSLPGVRDDAIVRTVLQPARGNEENARNHLYEFDGGDEQTQRYSMGTNGTFLEDATTDSSIADT